MELWCVKSGFPSRGLCCCGSATRGVRATMGRSLQNDLLCLKIDSPRGSGGNDRPRRLGRTVFGRCGAAWAAAAGSAGLEPTHTMPRLVVVRPASRRDVVSEGRRSPVHLSKPPSSAGATGAWQCQSSGPLAVVWPLPWLKWFMVASTTLIGGASVARESQLDLAGRRLARFGGSAENRPWSRRATRWRKFEEADRLECNLCTLPESGRV